MDTRAFQYCAICVLIIPEFYNRTIHTTPEILDVDKVVPSPAHNGLYQILLAMKYLRSSDEEWVTFVAAFDKLIQNNIDVVSLTAMNLPADWKAHLSCINAAGRHKIVKQTYPSFFAQTG